MRSKDLANWGSGALAGLLLAALPLLYRFGTPDFAQDYAAAWGWWHGRDPNGATAELLAACCGAISTHYPAMQTAHPPLATLLALPLGLLPWAIARPLWCLICWAAVVAGWQIGQVSLASRAVTASFWIVALVLGTHEPLIFVLLALAQRDQDRAPRRAGALVGLCAALKIYPGLLIIGLWLSGRRRSAVSALVAGGVAVLLGELILGVGATAHWLAFVPQNAARYVDQADNGSLVRLARQALPGASPVIAGLIASALSLPLLPRLRHGEWLRPLLPVMLLTSPLSWRHYAGLAALGPLTWIEQLCLGISGLLALLIGLELLPGDGMAPLVMTPLLLGLLLIWYDQAKRPHVVISSHTIAKNRVE